MHAREPGTMRFRQFGGITPRSSRTHQTGEPHIYMRTRSCLCAYMRVCSVHVHTVYITRFDLSPELIIRALSLSPSQEVEGDGDGGASSYDGIDGLCVHVDFNRPAFEISPPGYYLSRIITTATIFFLSVSFFSRSWAWTNITAGSEIIIYRFALAFVHKIASLILKIILYYLILKRNGFVWYWISYFSFIIFLSNLHYKEIHIDLQSISLQSEF